MSITGLSNDRFDPFDGAIVPNTITDEAQMVGNTAPFVVYLNEVPRQDAPSTVKIPAFVDVVTLPNPGEFVVDYKYRTGGILFNAADRGKVISASYVGIGSSGIVDYLNNKALEDPNVSFVNKAWKLSETGDHFGGSTIRTDRWESWTGSAGVLHVDGVDLSTKLHIRTTNNSYGYIASWCRHVPGGGFRLDARFRTDPASHASLQYIGCLDNQLRTTPSFTNILAGWRVLGGVVGFYYRNQAGGTGGGGATLYTTTLSAASPGTWHDYTAIFTPGHLMMFLDGTKVASIGSTEITTTDLGVVGGISDRYTSNAPTDCTMRVDYLSYVPLDDSLGL
jgi:hypothetical protein